MPANDRQTVESAIAGLKDAMKSDDKSTIEAKINVLSDAVAKISELMQSANAAGANAADSGTQEQAADNRDEQENVVDAEFEEVKDEDKR